MTNYDILPATSTGSAIHMPILVRLFSLVIPNQAPWLLPQTEAFKFTSCVLVKIISRRWTPVKEKKAPQKW